MPASISIGNGKKPDTAPNVNRLTRKRKVVGKGIHYDEKTSQVTWNVSFYILYYDLKYVLNVFIVLLLCDNCNLLLLCDNCNLLHHKVFLLCLTY